MGSYSPEKGLEGTPAWNYGTVGLRLPEERFKGLTAKGLGKM